MRCNACEVVAVNGTPTHELGCPEAWRSYSRECAWCGSRFTPVNRWETCCGDDCALAYVGDVPNEVEEDPWDPA